MICEKCGKVFEKDYRKDWRAIKNNPPRFCSRSCANGHVVDEGTKRKISASVKAYNESHPKAPSTHQIKLVCEVCGKTYYHMHRRTKTCSDECKRELQSRIRSRNIETKGGGGFLDVKWYDIKNIEGATYKVRGTWELKYAQFLNSRGILWNRDLNFSYRRKNDIKRTYIPDFFLPVENRIVEIKGYFSEKDQLKLALVEAQNAVQIEILFKEDLERLGISL